MDSLAVPELPGPRNHLDFSEFLRDPMWFGEYQRVFQECQSYDDEAAPVYCNCVVPIEVCGSTVEWFFCLQRTITLSSRPLI